MFIVAIKPTRSFTLECAQGLSLKRISNEKRPYHQKRTPSTTATLAPTVKHRSIKSPRKPLKTRRRYFSQVCRSLFLVGAYWFQEFQKRLSARRAYLAVLSAAFVLRAGALPSGPEPLRTPIKEAEKGASKSFIMRILNHNPFAFKRLQQVIEV